MSREHSRRQEPQKVQNAVPELQELRATRFQRALEEASVGMISDYCKMEGEGLLEEKKTSQKPLRNHNRKSLFMESAPVGNKKGQD